MVLAGVLAAGVIGGCGADGAGDAEAMTPPSSSASPATTASQPATASPPATPESPPASASPAATASPSRAPKAVVVAPVRPAEMDDDGPAGAEAAAVYFAELDSYMQATGDTAEWESISHSTCEFCADRLNQARALRAQDCQWTGGDVRVEIRHTYAQDAPTGIWPIDAMLTQAPATVTDRDGHIVAEIPAASGLRRIEVAQQDGHWVFVEAGGIPGE